MISWRIVSDLRQLDEIEYEWNALLERSDCNEPTLSHVWLRTWWDTFGGDGFLGERGELAEQVIQPGFHR